jgi:anti-sigma regulatory factor (Ser/Thr protein kinase)/ActR/RegA family two-component response regulator
VGHVVIVGSDRAAVPPLRQSLLKDGHEVTGAAGSVDAIRMARRRPVDVLITDPATPVQEDLALVEEVKEVRPDARTVVLAPAMSDADVIAAIRAHVFACFTAPFDDLEITDMARSALKASHWKDGIEVVSALPYWVTFRVCCRLLTADRLTRFMTEWRADLPSSDRDLLMTAFRELLLNAMEHGAGFDPEKVIQVTAARTKRAIVFHFRDPGNGFDRVDLSHAAQTSEADEAMAVLDRRAGEGRRPGGFGMLIARQVVDELVYNEQGNEVLMIKHTA